MALHTTIPGDEQISSDFDWFAIDQCGHIGHFTTAGFKLLPPGIAKSRENCELITNYFLREAPVRGKHLVDIELAKIVDRNNTPERYLRDFVFMAYRGLYSFDIDSYLSIGVCYFRVASPTKPLHLSELPRPIREVLTRMAVTSIDWSKSPTVPYEETLNW